MMDKLLPVEVVIYIFQFLDGSSLWHKVHLLNKQYRTIAAKLLQKKLAVNVVASSNHDLQSCQCTKKYMYDCEYRSSDTLIHYENERWKCRFNFPSSVSFRYFSKFLSQPLSVELAMTAADIHPCTRTLHTFLYTGRGTKITNGKFSSKCKYVVTERERPTLQLCYIELPVSCFMKMFHEYVGSR